MGKSVTPRLVMVETGDIQTNGGIWSGLSRERQFTTSAHRSFASGSSILGIAIAAMLSGANDLRAIFRWGRRLSPAGLASFGISHGKAPCHATYHYVFRDLAATDLDQLLSARIRADRPVGHVAIDGKRLRGSRDGDRPGLHLLVAWCKELRVSLGNFVVPPDSGELPEAIRFLKNLPVRGAILTMDAAFTNRLMLEAIREAGASYFLVVKDNQPELKAELAHAFGDTSPLGCRLAGGSIAHCG